MADDPYILEWSHRTSRLHVQRLHGLLSHNRRLYRDNEPARADFMPIAVGTLDEMMQAAEAIRSTVLARRDAASGAAA